MATNSKANQNGGHTVRLSICLRNTFLYVVDCYIFLLTVGDLCETDNKEYLYFRPCHIVIFYPITVPCLEMVQPKFEVNRMNSQGQAHKSMTLVNQAKVEIQQCRAHFLFLLDCGCNGLFRTSWGGHMPNYAWRH